MKRVLALTVTCYLIYLLTISLLTNYGDVVRGFGDNAPYVRIATAIKQWSFSDLKVKLFWGLPYTVAGLSLLTRLPEIVVLVGISIVASLLTIAFAQRLWRGWVAIVFLILSREWMERSLLGGAEPLFLALMLGAFLAVRRDRWEMAALLASLSTVVRPLGVFTLAGIGVTLLLRKHYQKLAVVTAIGLVIGCLYVLPLKMYFGSPLANVLGYGQADWNSRMPVGMPLVAMVQNVLAGRGTKLNLARTLLWIVFILTSTVVMAKKQAVREYAKMFPVEAIFWWLYLVFLFTYNSNWARDQFPRFVIPIICFSLFAMEDWIPRNYPLLFVLGILSAMLSAAETVGILEVMAMVHRVL